MKKFSINRHLLYLTTLIATHRKIVPYKKTESLFGKVIMSEKISKDMMESYMDRSPVKTMFAIINGTLFICDDTRQKMNTYAYLPDDTILHWWTSIELNIFFGRAVPDFLTFEKREKIKTYKSKDKVHPDVKDNILTIKRKDLNGSYSVFAYAKTCPPICDVYPFVIP